MAKKEPLYPHVPKSRLGAFICGQCGDRFHSIRELNEHLARYHPEADEIHLGEEMIEIPIKEPGEPQERRVYYCSIEERHPHREIIQVSTTQRDPECPYCGGIMTYGTWWPVKQAEE